MTNKFFPRFSVSLVLVFSLLAVSLPQIGYAQTAAAQKQVAPDLQKSLQTIEQKVDARRKELGIPGMSLVIIKDDQIVYMKGLGYKDFAKQIPVTPDTEFAIGSATKAFTALSVLMSQDEGKLKLDDSPKKYLPYFKINDPDTDKNITIRDLLSHASGLNRTDLAMITGKLTREELIRVAGEAKPTAKLREKFQYQNIMFAAAGEIVSKVQKTTWEQFVAQRILKPLGMLNSSVSVAEMQKAKDYSYGYDYNFDTKETRLLPTRDIEQVAPAGSINSSARDMSLWLKFILNRGEINGKRLVSEASFDEWIKPQMKIAGRTSYGLGWFLQDWSGLKVVQHGGNIDGFNSLVALIPEKKLGFVMLTNVSGSSLGGELMPIVWENILDNPNAGSKNQTGGEMEKEVGKYRFEAAGFDIDVKMQDGKLVAIVPGQPVYTLESVGARRYKLSGAPDGFFATFKDDSVYLEQPQGNYTLPKIKLDGAAETKASASAKELVGKYEAAEAKGKFVEICDAGGKVTFNVEGQQPYELKDKDKDSFSLSPLPDTYYLKAKRGAGGKISAVVITQPEGECVFNLVGKAENSAALPTVDEVMAKAIDALGGTAAMRKLTSRVTKAEIDFENQGVKGYATSYAKAPNKAATEGTLTALGKPIATIFEYFDGAGGGEVYSFSPAETYAGKRLENAKIENDFYGLLDWKNDLKSAEIRGVEKVNGEDAYALALHFNKASDVVYFISTKTFLPVKKNSLEVSSTSEQALPVSETFSDYRKVDGVMIPFKTASADVAMGNIVTYVKEVTHNVAIDDKMFRPKSETKAVGKN